MVKSIPDKLQASSNLSQYIIGNSPKFWSSFPRKQGIYGLIENEVMSKKWK